MNALKTPSN